MVDIEKLRDKLATNIVLIEFDSLKSTANKFGVNEEVVYHVKSLYR